VNLDQARLQLLAPPTTPLWWGTVANYNAATFCLTVATTGGAFPTHIENLLLTHISANLTRVRARDGNVLVLAETPVVFAVGDQIALYDARLPWPRYQRIYNGMVYKDFDIAFPTPWQAELPPTALLRGRIGTNDFAEAVWCQIGDEIELDASASYPNLADAAPLTYAWDAGAGGVIAGAGAAVSCSYSTPGFRYIRLVVSDAHGTTIKRYLPVWVGDALTVDGVTSCRARWDMARGWSLDIELTHAGVLLQYGPAAIVDAETRAVVFFGFVVPESRSTTFEIVTQSLKLEGALAFSRFLHAYPFLVTSLVDTETPSEWAEVYALTLARALWFLLYWHSTLPEVVNCDIGGAPERSIAGQEFTLGSVPQQVEAVLKSAFWQARGQRSGGFVVWTDPLFLSTGAWAALNAYDLSDPADLRRAVGIEHAQPTVNQVRCGGVYRSAATYQPALAQAPAAPGPWGAPAEVNGLAPVSAAELQAWAGRYIAIENTADRYSVEPGYAIDPALWAVADLPDGARIAVESADLTFDAAGLCWQHTIGGRAYGRGVNAVPVPLPPPIVYPTPGLPPLVPPIWDPLPEPEHWADGSHVVLVVYNANAGNAGAILRTRNFLDASPTWENITPASWAFVSDLLTTPVQPVGVKVNQVTQSVWVTLQGANGAYCVIRSTDAFGSASPTWALLPPQLSGSAPLNYGSNGYQYPRLLFDDTLTNEATMFVRLSECDESGVLISNGRAQWVAAFDDALALQGQTFMGWQHLVTSSNATVDFNDDFSGFLTFTYFTEVTVKMRRLEIPFGAVRTTSNPLVNPYNYISSDNVIVPVYPTVNVGTLLRLNASSTNVLHVTEDQIRAWSNSSPPGTPVGLEFNPFSFTPTSTSSEQPFARNLGRRPGWFGICGKTSASYGLWLSTDGANNFTRVQVFDTSHYNVRPVLFPNDNPYYAVFRRYGGPTIPAGVFAWDVDGATLATKTGNLNSVVVDAQWMDAGIGIPLDVWWGLE